MTVIFTDQSTQSPTAWAWTFGDDGTSTAQHPSHTYSAAGTYTVSLTASNANGDDPLIRADYITVDAGNASDVISITKAEYKADRDQCNGEATST